MPILTNDPLTQLAFSVFESKGVFALLLGSGLSRAAEIPTGWEITLDLIRRVALAQGVEEQADWASWYREQAKEEPNYSALLEDLTSSPAERRSILHSYIEPTEEDRDEERKVPTAAHYAIADLVVCRNSAELKCERFRGLDCPCRKPTLPGSSARIHVGSAS